MNIDILRPALGDELFAQVEAALKDSTLNLIDLSSGQYIPKAKFDDERNKVKQLTADLADRDRQLQAEREKSGSVDGLQAQIDQLTKDVADRDATIASTTKQYRIKDALRAMKARNVDVVMPLINVDGVTEKNGKLEGLSEQVEALQKSDAYLFDVGTNRGGFAGSQDIGGAGENTNAAMNAAIRAASGRHMT